MSLRDRFVDGVSSLFEKLSDGRDLGRVDPEELERELAQRVAARETRSVSSPGENPIAKLAGAGKAARLEREKRASERAAKIRGRRRRHAQARKRAQDAAFREMAEEARRRPSSGAQSARASSAKSSSKASRGGGASKRARARSWARSAVMGDDLAEHYKTLGVDPGVSDAELKSAYRKLMRKYHPDLHRDPRKKRAATQLATKISTAYAVIEKSRK